jgi:hypothetical protein
MVFLSPVLTRLRSFSDDVGPRGGPEVEVAVDRKLSRLVGLKSNTADESPMS